MLASRLHVTHTPQSAFLADREKAPSNMSHCHHRGTAMHLRFLEPGGSSVRVAVVTAGLLGPNSCPLMVIACSLASVLEDRPAFKECFFLTPAYCGRVHLLRGAYSSAVHGHACMSALQAPTRPSLLITFRSRSDRFHLISTGQINQVSCFHENDRWRWSTSGNSFRLSGESMQGEEHPGGYMGSIASTTPKKLQTLSTCPWTRDPEGSLCLT
jgi:hypothetical protein